MRATRVRPGRAPDRRPVRTSSSTAGRETPSTITVDEPVAARIRVSSHYPFERVEPAPRVRPGRGARVPPRPPGRATRCAGRRARRRTVRLGAARRRAGHGAMTRLSAQASTARATAPTTGDRVRLGDTDLWIRVARRPHGARRRAGLGLRQEPPQPDRRRATRRPGRRELDVVIAGVARGRPGHRRRQGRHRHQGRPDRRHRPGRATPRSATDRPAIGPHTEPSWATA